MSMCCLPCLFTECSVSARVCTLFGLLFAPSLMVQILALAQSQCILGQTLRFFPSSFSLRSWHRCQIFVGRILCYRPPLVLLQSQPQCYRRPCGNLGTFECRSGVANDIPRNQGFLAKNGAPLLRYCCIDSSSSSASIISE
jgi:hypothetical protein